MIKTFLPSIHTATVIEAQGEPDKAFAIYECMVNHPEQRRDELIWNQQLADIAHLRVMSQALQGWDGHVDPNGNGPNNYCRRLGYRLPGWYPDGDANNIESLCHGGMGKVEGAWAAWMGSPHHKTHILALDNFYAAQTQIGVGFYALPTSVKKFYWAIISCPPEE